MEVARKSILSVPKDWQCQYGFNVWTVGFAVLFICGAWFLSGIGQVGQELTIENLVGSKLKGQI